MKPRPWLPITTSVSSGPCERFAISRTGNPCNAASRISACRKLNWRENVSGWPELPIDAGSKLATTVTSIRHNGTTRL